MREIKFRGLSVSGEWYIGLLSHSTGAKGQTVPEGWYISNKAGMPWAYQVRPETVGQFTGVTDNFHKDVYDGDIFQAGQGSLFVVNWNEEECQWTALCFSGDHQGVFYLKKFMGENMEVIGNAYENSDLLLSR